MIYLVIVFLGLVAIFKNEIVKIGTNVIQWHKEKVRYSNYKYSTWFIAYMTILGINKKTIQRYSECRTYENQSVFKSILCMFGIISLYSVRCTYDYKGISVRVWKFGKWDRTKESLNKIISENEKKIEKKAKEVFPEEWENYISPSEVFIPGHNLIDLWY